MALNYECEMRRVYDEYKQIPCKFFKMATMLLTLASLDNNVSLAKYQKLCDLYAGLTHKVIKVEKQQEVE